MDFIGEWSSDLTGHRNTLYPLRHWWESHEVCVQTLSCQEMAPGQHDSIGSTDDVKISLTIETESEFIAKDPTHPIGPSPVSPSLQMDTTGSLEGDKCCRIDSSGCW
ncbi:hypothetical protein TNCV_2239571 [Trichonephila clavipes]|nr:hypothetical protein TNCV_2239571 [Trichonephila clavipes]